MMRRANFCALSRFAKTARGALPATLIVGRNFIQHPPPPRCHYKPHRAVECGTPQLYQSKRLFCETQPHLVRVSGSIRPQTSPASYTGSSNENTADSLTPYVRQHLTRVYSLLAAGCACAGMGSLLMFATPLGKAIPYWLPMVGGFVPLLWLSFAPLQDQRLKLALFLSFTVLEGMALAPLVLMTLSKGVLGTALVLSAAVFCGFSAGAYLCPRASLLAFQGPLFGMLIGMVLISLLNIIYPTAFAHSIILYGGLALFSALIAVDTQAMIERARCGAGDYVQDAMQMFLNVVNIFVRIAQILGSGDR
ncbi:putative Bax inhibitor 1 like Inhibitor of apoptosis promoting Bax1 [Trypanosoma vivax]|nr:putative Bax inhibitor 1 like Inhibitor of apoptosis promoting Bax1 [Trypanosoma vivax]